MKIVYFEPLTLVDYPGKLATTVFTPGCVFRCPYCHSPELVDPLRSDFAGSAPDRTEEFFSFLQERKGKIDGVCITGGEPTLHSDLQDWIWRIKEQGFLVKLDTNGIFPDRIQALLDAGLVDYWAMDIKHAPKKYAQACGRNVDVNTLEKSISLLMRRAKEYEFRTTAVPGIHTPEDFAAIGEWIAGARTYYIQPFRGEKVLEEHVVKKAEQTSLDYDLCASYARTYLKNVRIR